MNDEKTETLHILYVEDADIDFRMVEEMFRQFCPHEFTLVRTVRLADALQRIYDGEVFDIVLLDLILPDSTGVGTIASVVPYCKKMGCPVIVITSSKDQSFAIEAARIGADDYYLKDGIISTDFVNRCLFVAERGKTEKGKLATMTEKIDRMISILEADNG